MNRLKILRNELGLKQKDVARKIGINEREYGHYETGYRNPKIGTLIKIADLFDVSVDYLIGRSDENG